MINKNNFPKPKDHIIIWLIFLFVVLIAIIIIVLLVIPTQETAPSTADTNESDSRTKLQTNKEEIKNFSYLGTIKSLSSTRITISVPAEINKLEKNQNLAFTVTEDTLLSDAKTVPDEIPKVSSPEELDAILDLQKINFEDLKIGQEVSISTIVSSNDTAAPQAISIIIQK